MRFSPGCGCCSCIVFEDDFNRSNDTDVGVDWDEDSGDWKINSNKLRADAAAGLIITEATYAADHVYVSLSVIPTAAVAGNVYVIVDYVDSNNYHYFRLRFSHNGFSGRLQVSVGKRTGGTDSMIGVESSDILFTAGVAIPVQVCMTPTTIAGRASTLGTISPTTPHDGNKVAIRTDATQFDFEDFSMAKHKDVSAACDTCLSTCTTCPTPLELTVDLGAGGWTNDTCDACTSVAGEVAIRTSSPCVWMYEELAACDSSPTCQGETGCPQTLIFRVTTTLTPVFPQYKWRTVVTFTASKEPECTGDCVTGATATYDSDLFDVGDCNNFPFELDKVSEDTTDACGGALPATITLDE